MFEKTRNVARKYAAKAGALAVAAPVMLGSAYAQTTDGWGPTLDAVDLSGLAVKVAAIGILIVGIAIAFKAPDLGKRAVRKV